MTSAGRALAFSGYTLDLDGGRLLRGEDEIPLRPKSFAVLEYLVDHAGQLVSREELFSAVWRDIVVTDDSLTHCIADIRRALGENAEEIIRTVPRRGYLFSVPVTATADARGEARGPSDAGNADEVPDKPAAPAGAPSRAAWTSWRVVAGVALLLAVAAIWWIKWEAPASGEAGAGQAPPNSIAVLRFADMSEAQDQAYLADGLADEILHALAQIPGLIVIARTSSFALQGEEVTTVAAKLNVAYVLEGSVRRSGDRVRVTAQLVDAATSAHRWSKTYDRDLDEAFEMETEIAGAIANLLQATLADDHLPANAPRHDARAYELFLRGHFFYYRRAPGDIERARKLYEQAVEIDPELARAWVGLAATYNLQRWPSSRAHAAVIPEADADDRRDRDLAERQRQAVEQALRLAPTLPEVQIRAAHYQALSGNWEKAVEHFERARALDPDHPLVLGSMLAAYLYGNRLDEAVAVTRHAVLRDPLSAVTRNNLADLLVFANRLDEAMAEYRKMLPLGRAMSHGAGHVDGSVRGVGEVLLLQRQPAEALQWIATWPSGPDRDRGLAMAYQALGRPVDADAALERLVASAAADDPVGIAEVYAYRGDFDKAIAWLQRLGRYADCRTNHGIFQPFYSPFLARMRGDPRWEAWRTGTARTMRDCDFMRRP